MPHTIYSNVVQPAQAYSIDLPASHGGGTGIRFASLIALSESIKPPENVQGLIKEGVWQWIHLAPFGRWSGHPKCEILFSRDAFDQMIQNFARRTNPIKVDYEHDSLNQNMPGHQKVASGYIHDLEVRGDGFGEGDGLYGLTEFTAKAAQHIRDGEIKYNSPVINPNATDRKTDNPVGLELIQAAVTSDPFLDGQVPITLTRIDMAEQTQEKLPLTDPKPEPVVAMAEENAADMTSIIKQVAEMTGLDQTAVVAAMQDQLEKIAKLVGGDAEKDGQPADEQKPPEAAAATVQAAAAPVVPAVEAAPAPESGDVDALKRTMEMALSRAEATNARLDALEAEKTAAVDASFERQADELIAMKRCLPAERADAIWLLKNNPEAAQRMYQHQRHVGVTQLTREVPGKADETLTLTPNEEQRLSDLVGTGSFTRERAIEKILSRRSN